MAIRDHLSVNIEIRPEDMMDAPEFSGLGGIVKARAGAVRRAAAGAAG
jgi:type I restriction enzyme R subunit